jgi:anti-sigma-K factor RskA
MSTGFSSESRPTSRDDMADLAAGYALGVLNAEDVVTFARLVSESAELAADVATHQETMSVMAQKDAMTPPPALRDRLMRRIHESEPVLALPPVRNDARGRRAWTVGFGAALAASIAGLAWLGVQNAGLRSARTKAETLATTTSAKLDHREHTLNTLLHAEKDLRVVHLKAADTVKGPGIQFFWNAKERTGIAHAFRLHPAPAGSSYQLWLVVNGKPWSAKIFDSGPDGHAMVEGLELPATTAGVTDVVVTVEPRGGSSAPTGTVVMSGSMAAATGR